jgi:hypothetical protein
VTKKELLEENDWLREGLEGLAKSISELLGDEEDDDEDSDEEEGDEG